MTGNQPTRRDLLMGLGSAAVVASLGSTISCILKKEGDLIETIPGDLTGDGRPDLILVRKDREPTMYSPEYSITIRLRKGNGALSRERIIHRCGSLQPREIQLKDTNGDGNRDITYRQVYYPLSETAYVEIVKVMRGDGKGNFSPPVEITLQ